MIRLRRSEERDHDGRRRQEVWSTFHRRDSASSPADGFGALEILDEHHLPRGADVPRRPRRDAEIITYVHEGALAYEDSLGRSGVIHAGEFQRMSAGRGLRHREANASRAEWAHLFQIWLRPSEADFEPTQEQKRFSAAQRRGVLCVVASPNARRGSLRIHQDASIYSAMLEPGQHVVHELAQGRCAWLHVVQGAVTFGDLVLTTGDGAGITFERAVSFTAREETEILLVDLNGDADEMAIGVWSTRADARG